MSPQRLYRIAAVAEAITWTLLLLGMFAKYVTRTTDLGVSVAGALHGFVFLAFCATTVVVAVDQRWSLRQSVLGLGAGIPPLLTVPFERWAERRGLLGTRWRLREHAPRSPLERLVGYAVSRPIAAVLAIAVAVVVVFGVLLALGPPTGFVDA
ncbi:MAG: DUF3817 domain-containing protein [Ornithinimicrobium sp.]